MTRSTFLVIMILVAFVPAGLSNVVFCSGDTSIVLQVNLSGEITSATSTMMSDALKLAEAQNARLIIVTLNTPGGEAGAVQSIMNLFDNSTIPVCCYVFPTGATAWSGGTYVLMASHVAVMASGTTIGSCQPVSSAGEPIDYSKYVNAFSALMVNHAALHNRNETAAELFVTENLNLGSEDSLRYGVVDFLADNVQTLLLKLENFALIRLEGVSGSLTWKLVPASEAQNYSEPVLFNDISKAEIVNYQPGIDVLLLGFLYNPLVNSILLILGIFLFFIGVKAPGHGSEVAGCICLALAIIGFQAIGIGLGAVLLFAVGAIMIIAELKTHIGALALGGAVCMVLGSLLLFPSPQWLLYYQDIQQIQEVLITFAVVMAALFSFIVYKAAKTIRYKAKTGKEALIGAVGVVVKDLEPKGLVRVSGEFWQAKAEGNAIRKGQKVEVVKIEGLFVVVKLAEEKA